MSNYESLQPETKVNFYLQVTMMGQSAGSSSVLYHLMSPRSEGLFNQVSVKLNCCVNYMQMIANCVGKGTRHIRKKGFFRALPKLPPPPPPNSGKLYNFFWTLKTTFLRVLQNQVTMITTMMLVIIILVLLMILVLKMTKKYHIT